MGGPENIKGLSAKLSEEDYKKIYDHIDLEYQRKNTEDPLISNSSGTDNFNLIFNQKQNPFGPLGEAKKAVEDMAKELDPSNFKGAEYLMNKGQELANAMGIGQARMSEMRTTIADAIPEMMKLGMTGNEAFDVIKDVPEELGVNTTMATEAIVEMGAASKVSGLETEKLAKEFKNVGISLYDVGDKMGEVANYAKSVGVNVQAVSGLVVTNLKQLNLYNFDNGVKGLAKMASQATMLGISMDKTFKLADDLMSPEKAIELSASLQRLGVSSSALLDPLKAMDLAQNDPEALQKEMINVSKEFTKLKADGSGFEILPGAKRRLREVAAAMGMTADELANMSIKSADLDMKMSKIKFPSLASSEEDKMLIANMAQINSKGEAVVQIKNEKTGEMEEVNVSKLTADQITKLKDQQSDQNKSIEELAYDQLTVLQSIDANIRGGKTAVQFGKASTPAMERFYNAVNVVRGESVKSVTRNVTSKNVRNDYSSMTGEIEGAGVKALQGDFSGAGDALLNMGPALLKIGENIATGFGTALNQSYGNIKQGLGNIYSPVSGNKPLSDDDKSSALYTDLQNLFGPKLVTNIVEAFTKVATKQEVSGEVTHNFNIKGDGVGSLTQTEFNKFFLNAWTDPTIKSKAVEAYGTSNSGLMTDKK